MTMGLNLIIYRGHSGKMTKQLRGIIELGDPDCVHNETVRNEEEYNNHQIGRCKKCGRVRDYTIAQDWRWNNKSAKGGKKRKEEVFR